MGFSAWWKNKLADFIDDEVLKSATSWCRYRGGDRHCRYPHTLDADASLTEGHLVWHIVDRGSCPRDHWDHQFACPLFTRRPHVGDGPSPLPYDQGGQRVPLPPSEHLPEMPDGQDPWAAVMFAGAVQAVTTVEPGRVVLADGTIADPGEVLYSTYHPTEGLSPSAHLRSGNAPGSSDSDS